MALGDMMMGTQAQPQNLATWLSSPEGRQAVQQAHMQAQQMAQANMGEGGGGAAAQLPALQIQTPFGVAQYVTNGSGGGQIIGADKQWNQDYSGDGQRAERPTFQVMPDGSIGMQGFNETRGGGASGTNNELAMFAAIAAGGAAAGGLGGGAAGAGGGTAGTAAGGAAGGTGAAGAGAAGLAGQEALQTGYGASGAASGTAGGLGTAGAAAGGLGGYGGLISAGLGAVAGASESGPQTTSSQQQLPAWLRPAAEQYTNQAMQLAGGQTTPYTGQLGAPTNQYQNQAIGGIQGIAQGGDPTMQAGQNYTQSVLGGQYLNSNPHLDSMYNNAAQRITDAYSRGTAAQTDAMFARGGAYGGSAHADTTSQNQRSLGDSLSNFAANLYGNNYAQERQNQQSSANTALGYGQQNLTNWQALGSAGNQFQNTQQNANNLQYAEFQRQQQDPYNRLNALGGVFGNVGERTATQTTPGTGLAAGIIGGAAQGAGIYGQGQRAGWW